MNIQTSKIDVLIIGGGLAGLSSAIHLAKHNFSVVVIEKNSYPKHKVCGEYISNEVIPYLNYLDIGVFDLGAKKISKFELTTTKNKQIKVNLGLGGFGISRFCLDEAMAKKAVENGVQIIEDNVIDIKFINDEFFVTTKTNQKFISKIAIGAFGKRSNLDVELHRTFIKKKSPYLAVKTHVKGDFPDDLVALHNFQGGYCGVSKVEDGNINVCYITNFEAFKKHKDIETFQKKVLFKNNKLKAIFENTEPVFKTPLTISQISFETKQPVENHVIMCGDTAGMIHPLCGNGMSMAIRSAQIASHVIIAYLQGKTANRHDLEQQYHKQWNATFKNRLKTGHFVAALFNKEQLAEMSMVILNWFPGLLSHIIKRTHGKPMKAE